MTPGSKYCTTPQVRWFRKWMEMEILDLRYVFSKNGVGNQVHWTSLIILHDRCINQTLTVQFIDPVNNRCKTKRNVWSILQLRWASSVHRRLGHWLNSSHFNISSTCFLLVSWRIYHTLSDVISRFVCIYDILFINAAHTYRIKIHWGLQCFPSKWQWEVKLSDFPCHSVKLGSFGSQLLELPVEISTQLWELDTFHVCEILMIQLLNHLGACDPFAPNRHASAKGKVDTAGPSSDCTSSGKNE